MVRATLVFVFRGNPSQHILLGDKKRGFAHGKVDGFGGKVQEGESVAAAASRELQEESGLVVSPTDLLPAGVLTFNFPNKEEWDQEVHVFITHCWQGEPAESEEMRPHWIPIDEIPYERMWDDSHYWMPHVIAGGKIEARFTYAPDNHTVDHYSLNVVD